MTLPTKARKPVKAQYTQVHDDEWVMPKRRGYRMMCCDCGLVHEMDFSYVRNKRGVFIFFRARRHEAATSASRKNRQSITVLPTKRRRKS